MPRPAAKPRPAPSTSAVLLGLGAVCLVVAAIVFVSVQWSSLSIGAKAAVLLGVTTGFGALTWWSIRRGLRTSAETFSCIFVVLAAIDFAAAQAGGLLGDTLTDVQAAWVTAAIAVVAGAAWGRVAASTRVAPLTGAQVLASIGILWLCVLALEEDWARNEYIALALVVACVAVAVVAARLALWMLAVGSLTVGGLMLATAFAASLGRVLDQTTFHGLWATGAAVGWVVCLALAAVAASTPALTAWVRRVAACTATIGLALLVLRPLEGEPRNDWLAALAAVAVGLAIAAVMASSADGVWRLGARVALAPVTLGVGAAILPAVMLSAARIVVPATDPWQQDYGRRTHLDHWLLDVDSRPLTAGLAMFATLLALALALRLRLPSAWSLTLLATPCAAVAALGRAWPLWGVVVILAMLALIGGVVALAARSTTAVYGFYVAAAYTVLALTAALGSEVTTAVAAAGVCAVLAGAAVWAEDDLAATASAAASVCFGGLAATAALAAGEVADSAAGYVLVALAAGVVIAAQTRPGGSALRVRIGLEVGGVVVGAAAIALAAHDPAVQLPICLTVAGASVAAVGLVREDRWSARIAGGVLLIAATWSRLLSQDVDTVEWYTMPTAVALCVIGVWRMHVRPETSTVFALSPGLTLLLGPSLIATLPDPTSLRALLLGIGALAILLAGAYLRWAAPLVVAGVTLLALALVNVAPYANAVPRWVLFGLAGAALLYLGVTWERRLRNARTLIMAVELLR
ncbi:MAG TPA: hypothetical protein VLK59_12780 [Solirubrobacteraceae bacterium]|nr:hypothetical protein [Solirubrobacteraceae bacterium]